MWLRPTPGEWSSAEGQLAWGGLGVGAARGGQRSSSTPSTFPPLKASLTPLFHPFGPRAQTPRSRLRSVSVPLHLLSVNMAGRAGDRSRCHPAHVLRAGFFSRSQTHTWRPGRWAGRGRAGRVWASTKKIPRTLQSWKEGRGEEGRGEPVAGLGARENFRCGWRGGSTVRVWKEGGKPGNRVRMM